MAALSEHELLQPWKNQIERCLAKCEVCSEAYVSGEEILGTELHVFQSEPRISAPLRCLLCGAGCLNVKAYLHHVEAAHGPYEE